ncbi:MAG: GYD domain-containing protein [Ilumatobacteraceae bacterium]
MGTYIMLTTLTAEGAHTVHSNPDRLTAVSQEVEQFGCKVVAQYAVLGQYDFVTVVEAPDAETIAHLSVDLGSRGTTKIQTLPAIPIEALTQKLKGPQQLGR